MPPLEKLVTDIVSPYWWASVVFVGILINLASAYLKPKLDIALSHVSKKRLAKAERERISSEQRSTRLASDLSLLQLEVSVQTRDLVLSLVLLGLSSTFGFFLFLFSPYSFLTINIAQPRPWRRAVFVGESPATLRPSAPG